MAQSGHYSSRPGCPLPRVKQTFAGNLDMSAFDPLRKSDRMDSQNNVSIQSGRPSPVKASQRCEVYSALPGLRGHTMSDHQSGHSSVNRFDRVDASGETDKLLEYLDRVEGMPQTVSRRRL